MRHGRAPWPTPGELNAERRELYDSIVDGPRATESAFALVDGEGRLEGPFNAMLISPAVGGALQNLGAAIRYRTSLTDREREIAILALSVVRSSDFEWYAHAEVGRRIGLTDAELTDLADDKNSPSLSPEEVTIREVARRLVIDRDLTDHEFSEAQKALGQEKLAELITLVGYYDHLALALRVWRTPLPTGVASTFAGAS